MKNSSTNVLEHVQMRALISPAFRYHAVLCMLPNTIAVFILIPAKAGKHHRPLDADKGALGVSTCHHENVGIDVIIQP